MKMRIKGLFFAVCLAVAAVLAGCQGTEYTVSFDLNYRDCPDEDDVMVASGKKLEQPENPTREGYTFIGWFENAALTDEWDFSTEKVSADMTLYAGWDLDTGDESVYPEDDKDFSSLKTAGSQESSYEYVNFFLPEVDGISQPYVGDVMPYYEDGVYYIYYLKESGDSYNHSVYLATTTDFVTYTEYDDVVLEASRSGGQDGWIGTGSVVKVGERYYFFYTGHTSSASYEYQEKIMVAQSDNLYSFEKVAEWEIIPPDSLGQKQDFRDPQAYYDEESGEITLTVPAAQSNIARILKYTLSADLTQVEYEGIIFSDPTGEFWNLECSDTFEINGTWYITYSAQDDTLWYAYADEQFGPYSEPQRLDGKLFYSAKHVEDGSDYYMAGWARRSESATSTSEVSAWGGNLVVQKIVQNEDKTLSLAPVDAVAEQYTVRRELATEDSHIYMKAGSLYDFEEVFTAYESFMLTGVFTFEGSGSFGLAFDYNGDEESYKLISIDPEEGMVSLYFNEGSTLIAQTAVTLEAGEEYSFTYIQEGSVGTFYIDGLAALTVRIYGVSGKSIRFFAENNNVLFTSLREYTR
ncbi:MAG: InlB B-repeat-containing protein [Lachnospiraceae bacterium]|nr:InlB B-repeat-containing protein [Lachnospiraceae bacterium]